jgi:hypothetical protein
MFVRLHLVEVGAATGRETVLAVELKLDSVDDSELVVFETLAIACIAGCAGVTLGVATDGVSTVVVTRGIADDPGEETAGVVEVQSDVGSASSGSRGDGF